MSSDADPMGRQDLAPWVPAAAEGLARAREALAAARRPEVRLADADGHRPATEVSAHGS